MKYLPLLLLIGCTSQQEPINPTWTDVRPVFLNYCGSCHGPGSPRGDWSQYENVVKNSDKILDRVYNKRDMPLNLFMPDSKRELIKLWIEKGCEK